MIHPRACAVSHHQQARSLRRQKQQRRNFFFIQNGKLQIADGVHGATLFEFNAVEFSAVEFNADKFVSAEFGARKRTRTSTPLREPGPEPGASANSAIRAQAARAHLKLHAY